MDILALFWMHSFLVRLFFIYEVCTEYSYIQNIHDPVACMVVIFKCIAINVGGIFNNTNYI